MFQRIFDLLILTVKDGDSLSYYPTTAGNVVLFLFIALLFVAMASFSGRKRTMKVKQLAFSAMAVTLAVVTSFIKFASLPFGGSITLFSMFFVCLIGYLYGTKAGVLTGIAYGILGLILQPYIYHPVQVLLDYPIAFGCLGLAGITANSKAGLIKGYAIGVFGRYLCHVVSGYIFFASFAPAGMNSMVYTLGYNATYILPEAIVTVLILLIPPVQNALKQVKRMAAEE